MKKAARTPHTSASWRLSYRLLGRVPRLLQSLVCEARAPPLVARGGVPSEAWIAGREPWQSGTTAEAWAAWCLRSSWWVAYGDTVVRAGQVARGTHVKV